jgi:hypothetical protein
MGRVVLSWPLALKNVGISEEFAGSRLIGRKEWKADVGQEEDKSLFQPSGLFYIFLRVFFSSCFSLPSSLDFNTPKEVSSVPWPISSSVREKRGDLYARLCSDVFANLCWFKE